MFGALPQGLDRDFLIGHYLPATALFAVGGGLLAYHLAWLDLLPAGAGTAIADNFAMWAALAIVAIWLVATTLSALNEGLIAVMRCSFEQPGDDSAFGRLGRLAARAVRLESRLLKRKAERAEARQRWVEAADAGAKREAARSFVTAWPWDADRVAASNFGNAIRAFNSYSWDHYGLDPLVGWPRVRAVLPAECLAQVERTKTSVDFILNLIVAWVIVGLETVVLLGWSLVVLRGWWWTAYFGMAVLATVLIWVLAWLAVGAAQRWGEVVMAAFDIGIPLLTEALRMDVLDDPAERWQRWDGLSGAWLFRRPPECVADEGEASPAAAAEQVEPSSTMAGALSGPPRRAPGSAE